MSNLKTACALLLLILVSIALAGCNAGNPAASGGAVAINEIYVANNSNTSITVYARMATGNTVPIRTISGASTGLGGPTDIIVDTVNNEIYVANNAGNSITVYARTATGNTVPIRTISGAATGMSGSYGLSLAL